ncbi:hypothetical protein M422DRAFT_99171, partial [Sphaerobolus stellatus SS14]
AAVTLMKHGMFPCSPIQPSLAFDINLLELILLTMLNLAPNMTGWSLALEMFWLRRGYVLGLREALRKRFANALQWFNLLEDMVAKHAEDELCNLSATTSTEEPPLTASAAAP